MNIDWEKGSLIFFETTQRIWKRQENVRKAKTTLRSEKNSGLVL